MTGATWYEIHHRTAGAPFDYEASVSTTSYRDGYVVRTCNSSGCSAFSAAVVEN